MLGDTEGATVGVAEGNCVLGLGDGFCVGTVGISVGVVGELVTPARVGNALGTAVGTAEVGLPVGMPLIGKFVGETEGVCELGLNEGDVVG